MIRIRFEQESVHLKVVIVHGWRTSPRGEWYPLAESLLQARGHDVVVPELPRPLTPSIRSWVATVERAVGDEPEGVFIIAHSLGAFTTLRYLERLAVKRRSVAGTLLVAPPFAKLLGKMPNWLFRKPDLAKAKQAAGRTVLLHDQSDTIVLAANSLEIAAGLGVECIFDESVGHFIEMHGFDNKTAVDRHIVQRFTRLAEAVS